MVFRRAKEELMNIEWVNDLYRGFFPYWLKQHIKYLQNRSAPIRILEKDKKRTKTNPKINSNTVHRNRNLF